MKIAVIGAGMVGRALGGRWIQLGHDVVFGLRSPQSENAQALVQKIGEKARILSLRDAAKISDIIVLAVPWSAAKDVIMALGDIKGKIVVDPTNPLKPDLSGLVLGFATSAAEEIAGWAKGARVVKAFNSTGFQNMANPVYGSLALTMFISGDDTDAKKTVAGLAEELGFDACDAGPLSMARYLEPLAALWIGLAYSRGMGPGIGFRLLKR